MEVSTKDIAKEATEESFETVKSVSRECGAPEKARRQNNQTRDMRTNLGRGKPGTVVQD